MEISLPNSTATFTSHPETLTYIGKTYLPIPMQIGQETVTADQTLPKLTVNVWNVDGMAYRFAKDNDLSLRDVTIRLMHTDSSSGDEASIRMQILGATFTDEVAAFELGLAINFDAEGPRRTYNRRDFPGIPINQRAYAVV